ncbi:MAG TPA: glycosyltransferase family 2 protein, partial [Blastocatellia bacterium]|nr:glycosyltransferase family 2 protein [Blastocatellia bacterium]
MKLSVVIPTFNRPDKLNHTVDCLRKQSLPADDYEIVVVDNGSVEPVGIAPYEGGPACRLIRFERNQERAIARNTAAEAARGELLLFSDDDLGTESGFLEAH